MRIDQIVRGLALSLGVSGCIHNTPSLKKPEVSDIIPNAAVFDANNNKRIDLYDFVEFSYDANNDGRKDLWTHHSIMRHRNVGYDEVEIMIMPVPFRELTDVDYDGEPDSINLDIHNRNRRVMQVLRVQTCSLKPIAANSTEF